MLNQFGCCCFLLFGCGSSDDGKYPISQEEFANTFALFSIKHVSFRLHVWSLIDFALANSWNCDWLKQMKKKNAMSCEIGQ